MHRPAPHQWNRRFAARILFSIRSLHLAFRHTCRPLENRDILLVNVPVTIEVAKRFELDPRRVKILPAGVLILEQLSQLLGQPLQIGKGGLREGVILDRLRGHGNDDEGSDTLAA